VSGARPAVAVSAALAPSSDLGAATDRGLHHPSNEDCVALGRAEADGEPLYVLVVCDGVSSSYDAARAASVAADTARDALLRYARTVGGADPSAAMVGAIRDAHRAACTRAAAPPDGQDPAGTTLVAALAQRGQVTLGWVGDSRAYWVAPSGAGLLTRDHSWVTEVVDHGEMDEATALRSPGAHALTHCLGPLEEAMGDGAPEAAVATFQPPPGCRLVLCSDGLWNYAAGAAEIAALVGQTAPDASAAAIAQSLVAYALTRGGQDNVTAAVALLA
jgi:serine/threonine protein phosphatase PrpC